MSDDLPALPNSVVMPSSLLSAWIKLPPGEVLSFPMTKEIIDHLFFAVDNLVHAHDNTESAVAAYVTGDVPGGHKYLDAGRRRMIEGQNNLRQFLIAIISAHLTASQ